MRFYVDSIGLALLLPLAVGAGLVLTGAALARRRLEPLAAALAGLAPGAAVLLATHLLGWLVYPPRFTNEWLFYIALFAGVAYIINAGLPSWAALAWLVPLGVGAATAWVQMPRQPQVLVAAGPFWLLFLPQIILYNWLVLQRPARETDSVAGAVPIVAWAIGVALLVGLTGNARFAQVAGMAAATLGGGALAALGCGPRSAWRHLVPGASVLLAGIVLQGYLFSRSDWEQASPHDAPLLCFVFVLAAPLATLVGELPGSGRLGPWTRTALRTLALALVIAFALHAALTWPEPMPESPGDDEW